MTHPGPADGDEERGDDDISSELREKGKEEERDIIQSAQSSTREKAQEILMSAQAEAKLQRPDTNDPLRETSLVDFMLKFFRTSEINIIKNDLRSLQQTEIRMFALALFDPRYAAVKQALGLEGREEENINTFHKRDKALVEAYAELVLKTYMINGDISQRQEAIHSIKRRIQRVCAEQERKHQHSFQKKKLLQERIATLQEIQEKRESGDIHGAWTRCTEEWARIQETIKTLQKNEDSNVLELLDTDIQALRQEYDFFYSLSKTLRQEYNQHLKNEQHPEITVDISHYDKQFSEALAEQIHSLSEMQTGEEGTDHHSFGEQVQADFSVFERRKPDGFITQVMEKTRKKIKDALGIEEQGAGLSSGAMMFGVSFLEDLAGKMGKKATTFVGEMNQKRKMKKAARILQRSSK